MHSKKLIKSAISHGLITPRPGKRTDRCVPTLCTYRASDYLSTAEALHALNLGKSTPFKTLSRYGLQPFRLAGKNPAALFWPRRSVQRVAREREKLFTPPPAADYYTAAEAAAILGTSRASLTRLVQSGQLTQHVCLLQSPTAGNARRKVSFFLRTQIDSFSAKS